MRPILKLHGFKEYGWMSDSEYRRTRSVRIWHFHQVDESGMRWSLEEQI